MLAHVLPPLLNLLREEAPHIQLSAMQIDAQHMDSWLETGTVDFAMGSFPHLPKSIRRQPLWIERYVSVVRKSHPRLTASPSLKIFAAEKHVLVSTFGTGHPTSTPSAPSKRRSRPRTSSAECLSFSQPPLLPSIPTRWRRCRCQLRLCWLTILTSR
jgi:DNA-binding transcriptional LysR family regulator